MSNCMSEIFSQEAGLVCSKTIEISKLTKERDLLLECVEFYGSTSYSWEGKPLGGQLARNTLKEIKQLRGEE